MKEKTPFDFERFKQEAMEGLYAGKKAGGTDGVFAPLMKHLLESISVVVVICFHSLIY